MTVWMYFETDGDSGYYGIKLFQTEKMALDYKDEKHDAYGNVTSIEVEERALPYQNLECPDCGSEMISRKNRESGQIFWGCKKYPVCKGTRDSEGKSRADRAAEREKNPSSQQDGFRFNRG